MYILHQERYIENKAKMYSFIWGQCSNTMQSKLQSKQSFQQTDGKNGFVLVQTVEDNKTNFTKKEIAVANNTRKLYHNIGQPEYKTFYDVLDRGLIQNCTVSMSDAKNTVKIYLLDEGALKGKSVQKKPDRVDTYYTGSISRHTVL